jgi:ribosomal protein S18 acetylase RimI-like enzyme
MIHLQHGIPPDQRTIAAQLYWQAFGGKLGRVMGPDARALRYLDRIIRNDHAIAALDETGSLLGMIGFKTPQGSFADGSPADMRAIYGAAGTAWRMPLFWALSREVDNTRFLIDGIAVDRAHRSHGIGTALIDAACDLARDRGYPALRLDVVDTNWRAKALYARLGFKTEKTASIGPLRHVFGFAAATTMVKDV